MRVPHRLLAPLCLALAALAVRLWWAAPFGAAVAWSDPDGYLEMARALSNVDHGWRWTHQAVAYAEFIKAPLYQTLLSGLTTFDLPIAPWALTLHALLDTVTVIGLFVLGRSLHSRRAGLIAAGIYALWIPNVLVTSTLWQEHLYIPLLVCGLALLANAVDRDQRPVRWAAAGAVLGLAALTRSSVLYFIPLAGLLLLRRSGTFEWRAAALCAGFALVTAPYIAFLSTRAGHVVLVEDIGAFALKRSPAPTASNSTLRLHDFMRNSMAAPTGLETLRFLSADFRADPRAFVLDRFEYTRMLFKPAGSAFLRNASTSDRGAAARLKAFIHLGLDLPFIAVAVLAPLGVALSRQRQVAWVLAVWVAQLTLMLALAHWAGVRFRAPIEPALIALAAAVLAGPFARPRPAAMVVASVAAAGMGLLTMWDFRAAIDARPAYGVTARADREWDFQGAAGLTIIGDREIRLVLDHTDPPEYGDAVVDVSLNGRRIDQFRLEAGASRTCRYPSIRRGGGYIEIRALRNDGRVAAMQLRLP